MNKNIHKNDIKTIIIISCELNIKKCYLLGLGKAATSKHVFMRILVKHLNQGPLTNNFVMLTRFCLLSKPPPLPGQYHQAGEKMQALFMIVFQVLKVLLTTIYKMQPQVLLFLIVLH